MHSVATKTRRLLALLPLVAVLGLMPVRAGDWVGRPLPDLGGFRLEGDRPELRGRVVLLDFWASWCAPCKASFSAMADLHRRLAERGLVVLAVSVDDDPAACARFVAQARPPFSVVRDVGHKLVAALDVPTMPTSFLIDRQGVVRFRHEGFHGSDTVDAYRKQIEQLLAEPTP